MVWWSSSSGHLRKECLGQHRYGSIEEAREVISSWIRYYNLERPHQAVSSEAIAV